jgi:hypothetical protein
MAAPWNPPVKNEDFSFRLAVEDFANPGNFRSNPTIAAGDFQISKDGGAFANLTNLPAVEPASSRWIEVILTSTEMNADTVVVQAVDQTSPKEWADFGICILTTSA